MENEKKKIKEFSYSSAGGMWFDFDLHIDFFKYREEEDIKVFEIYFSLGNKDFSKSFESTIYPKVEDFAMLLNKINFEEIKENNECSVLEDYPIIKLTYSYDDKTSKTIKYPDNKDFTTICYDFIERYIFKDNEIQNICKESENPNAFYLKYVMRINDEFRVEDYNL
ncbi:MAG: hypothetical protein E7310_07295 [Clostridiales bacterium]|nr:hypothetical protein [Clostridiales bacterium]